MKTIIRIIASFTILFFLGNCALRTNITPKMLETAGPYSANAALYFKNIESDTAIYNTPENYKKWIREIFSQAFSRVEEIDKLSDADETNAKVVIVVSLVDGPYGSILGLKNMMSIRHKAEVTVLGINNTRLFAAENTHSHTNYWGLPNDFRNATIKTFTPIIQSLLRSTSTKQFLSSNKTYPVASRFKKPSTLSLASKEQESKQKKVASVSEAPLSAAVMDLTDEQTSKQPAAPIVEQVNFGSYYAIVIGNNSYLWFPRLNTAISDAKAVVQILRDLYGYNATLLLDATREQIVETLDEFRMKLTSQDNLLIYYAGHGWYDEDEKRGYWLPVNAKETSTSQWLSNVTITDKLRALSARHVIVVADSCYSGTLTRGIKVKNRSPGYVKRLLTKRSRTALTSGGLEPVLDSGGGNHSVFAKAFLSALRANTSIVDGTQLFSQVRESVRLAAPQDPQYSNIRFTGHEIGGDFLFVRK